jgi:hypothetical protein
MRGPTSFVGRFSILLATSVAIGCSAQAAQFDQSAPCRPWRAIGSPRFGGGTLYGVSGSSSIDAWAVGQTNSAHPIIERWDGTRWRALPQPVPMGMLADVAAISSDDAWAVGNDNTLAVIEHWDGAAWAVVPAPYPSGALLDSVIALASNDVWVGGQYSAPNGTIQPLFLHWDGTAWRRFRQALGTELSGGIVFDLWALTPTEVWAVGQKGTPVFTDFVPLAEHWDGSSWTLVDVPSPQEEGANILRGVSGVASDDVWGVGSITDGWFIERWDGTAWNVELQDTGALLFGVAAVGTDDVWAVGSAYQEPSLILHWDGMVWTQVPAPQAGAASSLRAIDIVSPNDIWAAGNSLHDETSELSPLLEHYSGPCGTT